MGAGIDSGYVPAERYDQFKNSLIKKRGIIPYGDKIHAIILRSDINGQPSLFLLFNG